MREIEEALASGESYASICRRFARKFKLTQRQIRNYIAEIYRRWQEELKEETGREKARAIRLRRRLFQRALEKGDLKLALRILDSEARIFGLFEERKAEEEKREVGRKIIVVKEEIGKDG